MSILNFEAMPGFGWKQTLGLAVDLEENNHLFPERPITMRGVAIDI